MFLRVRLNRGQEFQTSERGKIRSWIVSAGAGSTCKAVGRGRRLAIGCSTGIFPQPEEEIRFRRTRLPLTSPNGRRGQSRIKRWAVFRTVIWQAEIAAAVRRGACHREKRTKSFETRFAQVNRRREKEQFRCPVGIVFVGCVSCRKRSRKGVPNAIRRLKGCWAEPREGKVWIAGAHFQK